MKKLRQLESSMFKLNYWKIFYEKEIIFTCKKQDFNKSIQIKSAQNFPI